MHGLECDVGQFCFIYFYGSSYVKGSWIRFIYVLGVINECMDASYHSCFDWLKQIDCENISFEAKFPSENGNSERRKQGNISPISFSNA